MFETIAITLVCEECLKTDHPELYASCSVGRPRLGLPSVLIFPPCLQVHAQTCRNAALVVVGEDGGCQVAAVRRLARLQPCSSLIPTPLFCRADDPAMLLRESMGVGADSTNKAFHAQDINDLFARPPVGIHRDHYEYYDKDNINHVVLAVDPAGGGASAFAVASVCQLSNGSIVVRLSASQLPRTPSTMLANSPIARRPTSRRAKDIATRNGWGIEPNRS